MGDEQPNEHSYANMTRSCTALHVPATGAQVHTHAVKSGFLSASFMAKSIVSMYMKCGCYEAKYDVFRSLSEPNLVSHNAMIAGLAASSQPEMGLDVFRLMKLHEMRPNRFLYVVALVICSKLEDSSIGAALHCDTIKVGLDVTTFVGNVILGMYSKHGTIMAAEQVFLSVEDKDVVTWNTYIVAHS
jgi:pentatricopeptide repeat protein